jgi:hypothetical protein
MEVARVIESQSFALEDVFALYLNDFESGFLSILAAAPL